MNVADYLVDFLIKNNVTDVFGIPGGVVLRLLEALDKRKDIISAHLTYHEQTAGFAACGYAQASGKFGVSYATRGPGISNMMTSIAEAYQESLPVLFITAHGKRSKSVMRFEYEQEIDYSQVVNEFTKYSVSIERLEDVVSEINKACNIAFSGRKGPVFLDFSSTLWNETVSVELLKKSEISLNNQNYNKKEAADVVVNALKESARPIILIGDGIRQSGAMNEAYACLSQMNIPILSSRASQDILCECDNYFGYIGSHGCRYSNFILMKADLIITIGNRLSFPTDSVSFRPIIDNAKIIRVDIDQNEFSREIPETINLCLDSSDFISEMRKRMFIHPASGWLDTCNQIKKLLDNYDINQPVINLENLMKQNKDVNYVCDVGNNEFWFSRAYEHCGAKGKVFYSKVFGSLGSGIGRAIGVFYGTAQPVVLIVGDQGFQYNIQELQYIKQWNLPITIVVVNNNSSGMIRDHEAHILKDRYIHVTYDNGYSVPNIKRVVTAYGILYINSDDVAEKSLLADQPMVIEIKTDEEISLVPNLPKSRPCNDMEPLIDRDLYKKLNSL